MNASNISRMALTFLLLLIVGCSHENTSNSNNENQESLKFIQDMLLKPKEDKIRLLALKYDVEPYQVEIIVRTFLANDYFFNELSKSGIVKRPSDIPELKSIDEIIEYLEHAHQIPSNVLASIIIDYRIWVSIEESGHDEPIDWPSQEY